jgi:hypothetical protein
VVLEDLRKKVITGAIVRELEGRGIRLVLRRRKRVVLQS